MSTPTYTYPITLRASRNVGSPVLVGGSVELAVSGEPIYVAVLDHFTTKAGVTVRKHTAKRVGLPSDLIDMLDFGTDGWLKRAKPSRAGDFFEWAVADIKNGGGVIRAVSSFKRSLRVAFGKNVSTDLGERCDSWSKDGNGNYFFHFTLTSEKPLKLFGKPLTPCVQA